MLIQRYQTICGRFVSGSGGRGTRLNHVAEAERPFYERSRMGSTRNMRTTASSVNFSAILSCEIFDFGQQLSFCVDGISEGKATD